MTVLKEGFGTVLKKKMFTYMVKKKRKRSYGMKRCYREKVRRRRRDRDKGIEGGEGSGEQMEENVAAKSNCRAY